ncbi:universal stress protein [Propionivibrio soli]|uniref:universal stress protein n=1 Tax=Propionivibrio soli TaxID=2976531 RepID=UPI0021E81651|nr:universal stress protein [Propionivibrio soli]
MSKRIFVAIDSSPTAAKALEEAIELAKALRANLCIAHASDESSLMQHGMGLGSYIDVDKVKVEIQEAANKLLDQAVAKAVGAGVQPERLQIESTEKRVAEMLAEAAKKWRADLMVVGTHGRRGVQRLLVGSVAENLVRIGGTSLLLVRGK